MELGIVYLGQRGGGAALTNEIAFSAVQKNVQVQMIISSRLSQDDLFDIPGAAFKHTAREFKGKVGIFVRPFIFVFLAPKLTFKFKKARVKVAIFPMASPFDSIFQFSLQIARIKVIRVIHDAEPHPGEYWPSQNHIKRLVKNCDKPIFLSHFVASKFFSRDDAVVCNFPKPIPRNVPVRKVNRQVCILGRSSDYKGIILLDGLIRQTIESGINILIAGEIANNGIPRTSHVSFEPGWISNNRLNEIIASSEILLLPYIEASQSGLIPIAKHFGTKILVTPVGGLTEQLCNYEKAVTSDGVELKSILRGLDRVLKNDFDMHKCNDSKLEIIDVLLYLYR